MSIFGGLLKPIPANRRGEVIAYAVGFVHGILVAVMILAPWQR